VIRFFGRVEGDADGIAPALHEFDLLAHERAQAADTGVARGEMLLGMKRDRPLADLRFPVTGVRLMLFRRHFGPLLAEDAYFVERRPFRHFHDVEEPEIGVVDRDDEAHGTPLPLG